MEQLSRGLAVLEFIQQLKSGIPIPQRFHEGSRVYFADALATAEDKTCVVCGIQLVGHQRMVCAGHWDWVQFEPLEEFEFEQNPHQSLIEFLFINLRRTLVIRTRNHWQAGLHGHSRCEVCKRITLNVEVLVTLPHGSHLKRHTVCPEHATFRWEDSLSPIEEN
ncbi:MAG: hypothetical protein F2618_01485 [Actinobacteria bacterium]|nr:hypothetical protein [Actinomycetota bacterium]